MKNDQISPVHLFVLLAAAISLSFLSVSCDSGGGGSASVGGSTIMGNVSGFSGGGGAFFSTPDDDMLAKTMRQVMDLFVAAAMADAGGVTVSIPALGLDAVTGEDGAFIFTEVPGGSYEITFSFEGTTVVLGVTVPDNAVIELRNVTIDDGSVDVDDIEVTVKDDGVDGEREETITICHRPPGNSDNGHSITIGISALDPHLNHGDTVGSCDDDADSLDDDGESEDGESEDGESEDGESEDGESEDGESEDGASEEGDAQG
ncbi:MAG: hypothetical protein O2923_10970 [Verrucomicrobia bacterium]|nr:hypothetical protein [Verrucomicrobiota bacterium]MDA1088162.1 hypothetical protein [Verrucomicrobiota bacterium]